MKLLKRVCKYLSKPRLLLRPLLIHTARLWPDDLYLKLWFYASMGQRLDLKNPRTFNEKLQWLKLYNRRAEYTTIVDKYAVKKYVADIIGEEYIIPTLGVWESFDEIDFNSLPEQFVLKTTHGGGGKGVVICRDKSTFDFKAAKKRLERSLKKCAYPAYGEWPYRDVPRRIIAEQYIEEGNGVLTDYKFFCFGGKADCLMLCCDRFSGDTKFYFFDRDWKLLRLNIRGKNAPEGFTLPKPPMIDEMFALADKLSKGMPFVRADLFCTGDRIYFGELTFYPKSGFDDKLLPETDIMWGNMLKLW